MSQAEVEHAKLQFELGEFRIVEYKTDKRRIICHVNETNELWGNCYDKKCFKIRNDYTRGFQIYMRFLYEY